MSRQRAIRWGEAAGLLCMLVLGMWVLRARSQPTQPAPLSGASVGPSGILISIVRVTSREIAQTNRISGQVEPLREATVAAEVANRVERRYFERGDRLAAGAMLVQLDSSSAVAALSQGQNALAQAVAARKQAETAYQRSVVDTEAVQQQAQAQLAQAQSEEKRADAQLAVATAGQLKTQRFTRSQELRQAEDALIVAQTDEKLAGIELKRTSMLVAEGAEARQALDRAQASYDSALARRKSASEALSLAKEGARKEDRDAASAQVSAAESAVATARQQVEAARANLRSANTRDTQLEVIRRQIDGLKAQESQARDAIRQSQILLDKHAVRMPFAGRVLARLVEAGDLTAPGGQVARIADVSRVKVVFSVPEATRPLMRLGAVLSLTVDALPRRHFEGSITAMGYQADAKSRAFPIEVTIDNADEALLPNMVARLDIASGAPQRRILVPAGAVSSQGASTVVYAIENGRAFRREVVIGEPFGEFVEVKAGILEGMPIAAAPQRLSDGVAVSVSDTHESELKR